MYVCSFSRSPRRRSPHRARRFLVASALLTAAIAALPAPADAQAQPASRATTAAPYTLEQLMGYTFPSDLATSPVGSSVAWTMTRKGSRSLWAADGPDFRPRQLVDYATDDGQELTQVTFSGDGRYVVYVRGGDHGSNWPAERNLMPNPTGSPVQPKMQIWSVPAAGGTPVLLGDGDAPAPSPRGDRVAFERDGEIWTVPIDGSKPAARLFFARGRSSSPTWSPDGSQLAFVSTRGSLAYIALYTADDRPLRYIAPSTGRDDGPRWSPDGTRIAFVRRPGRGGPAQPPLQAAPRPWSLWVADVRSLEARQVWQSPTTLAGSYPSTQGGANLAWAAGDRLVFLSYEDKWPHVYSLPAAGGTPLLLTPGEFMVEYVTVTPDRRSVIYNANTGADRDDIERRHLFTVPVDAARPVPLTPGTGLEWSPLVTADGRTLVFFGSTAQQPPLPFVKPLEGTGSARPLSADLIAQDFPTAQLVTPEHVVFKATDGVTVHGQLFKTGSGPAKRPAVIFVHGGPPRQMLLGWHYRYYYANTYAMNQYLASRGFIVLSVNFRLGIGYGFDFHNPPDGGARGASEYRDVLAGARLLQGRADVDAARIGIWGGSYGGYLTALALARNSDIFAAGVDLHGVHNWATQWATESLTAAAVVHDGVTPPQLEEAARVSWTSSPVSSIDKWKSPVLLIHGDDDRNVRVDQTVDLVQRLQARGVLFEEIVVPDDIHDFLLYRNWLRINQATADFLERHLMKKTTPAATTGAASGPRR